MLLAERTTSALPLSIGTSLALESLLQPRGNPYDPQREIPIRINTADYSSLWIHISTLTRNLIGSLPKAYQDSIVPEDLIDTLLWEMETIESIVKEDTIGQMRVVFYYDDYRHLTESKTIHGAVQFRVPKTPAQHLAYQIQHRTAEAVLKRRPATRRIKGVLRPDSADGNRALIITHQPYDLLSYSHFNTLHLLESHTGKLKTRKDWYSKYHQVGEEDLSILPFTRKLLFIFGDHSLIKPMAIQFRKLILEIARQRSFTPLTTEDKIKFYLDSDLKERYLFEAYNRL